MVCRQYLQWGSREADALAVLVVDAYVERPRRNAVDLVGADLVGFRGHLWESRRAADDANSHPREGSALRVCHDAGDATRLVTDDGGRRCGFARALTACYRGK